MTWLYVPSHCLPAVEDSTSGSIPPYLERAQSVTWRGKPMPQRRLSREWLTGSWMTRLSGLTRKPSTLERGVTRWISSLRDSHARTSASPGPGPGSTGSAPVYGARSHVAFARFDPSSSSWKTSQPSLLEDSIEFSVTWPASGTMRNGVCYERPTLAPRTGARGASWSRGETWAKTWNTPTTSDRFGIRQPDGKRSRGLNTQAERWPTPAATDWKGSSTPQQRRGQLTALAEHWPTPAAVRNGPQDPTTQTAGDSGSGRAVLNPQFVEALMGFPVGWTDCDYSEMPSSQPRPQRQSER